MKRSQLGYLAESFANGELNRPDYERQRGELIDEITSGRQEIRRHKPGEPHEPTVSEPTESAPHSGLRLALAASAVVVLLVLVWLAAPTT